MSRAKHVIGVHKALDTSEATNMLVHDANFCFVESTRVDRVKSAIQTNNCRPTQTNSFSKIFLLGFFWPFVQTELSATLQCNSLCRSRSAQSECALCELILQTSRTKNSFFPIGSSESPTPASALRVSSRDGWVCGWVLIKRVQRISLF